jgi:hypothetical protein
MSDRTSDLVVELREGEYTTSSDIWILRLEAAAEIVRLRTMMQELRLKIGVDNASGLG